MNRKLSNVRAVELTSGPCDGEVAEVPVDPGVPVWRNVRSTSEYALYRFDAATGTYLFANERLTYVELADKLKAQASDARVWLHSDAEGGARSRTVRTTDRH